MKRCINLEFKCFVHSATRVRTAGSKVQLTLRKFAWYLCELCPSTLKERTEICLFCELSHQQWVVLHRPTSLGQQWVPLSLHRADNDQCFNSTLCNSPSNTLKEHISFLNYSSWKPTQPLLLSSYSFCLITPSGSQNQFSGAPMLPEAMRITTMPLPL